MTAQRRGTPRHRAIVALAVLTLVIVGLHWASRFELGGPTGWGADALDTWMADPVLVIATVARWLALGLAYYLAILMAAITATGDSAKIARIAPKGLFGPIAAVVGVAIVVTPMVATRAPSDTAPRSAESDVLRLQPMSSPLVLRPESGDPDPPTRWDVGRRPPDVDVEIAAISSAAPIDAEEVIVEPGDSLWSLACDELTDAWQRPVTDDEVVPYWRLLIERNRDRLVDPANPDLILPGQTLVLPGTPPAPRGSG